MDGSGTFWYNGDRERKGDALMKRLPLILLTLTTLATVVFCLLWQGARRDHSDLVTLARSGAAETCTRFSDYQVHWDDGDYWGGVAAFRPSSRPAPFCRSRGAMTVPYAAPFTGSCCYILTGPRPICRSSSPSWSLWPKTPQTHPPGCGCMSCGIFCRRMRDFRPYHAGVHG